MCSPQLYRELPAVLLAHLAVSGDIDLRGHDKSFMVGGEECVDVGGLGSGYDYVALGHIHCPQWIKGGRKLARYCGTPYPIHFDETYDHGVDVVSVEAGKEPEARTEVFEPLHALATLGGKEGRPFDEVLELVGAADLPTDTFIRLNVRLGTGEMPGVDWTERARKMLTMAELKELSDDEVLEILTARHELSERQRDLVKALMKEMMA